VKILPFRSVVRLLGLREATSTDMSAVGSSAGAERIRWAMRTAVARVPWNTTCLVQALAAAALLRRQGISGTLSLGVGKADTAEEGVLAHAWLQSGQLVLTGDAEPERFAELTRFALR
jgi:Transglutaminase-like superfamily